MDRQLIYGPPQFMGWEVWANWLPVRWKARYLAWRLMRSIWRDASPESCTVRVASSRGVRWFQIVDTRGRVIERAPVAGLPG